jgi:hypothetical protein
MFIYNILHIETKFYNSTDLLRTDRSDNTLAHFLREFGLDFCRNSTSK